MVPRCTLVHGVGVDGAGVDGEDSGHGGDVTEGMLHVAVVHTDGSSRHLDVEDDADDDNERHDEHGVHGQHMLEDDGDMLMVVVVAQPSSNSVKGERGGGEHDGDDDDVEDMRSKDEVGNRHRPPPRCTLDTEK